MLEGGRVEAAVAAAERPQVQRGEVARGVVEEHVLRARVGRVDAATLRAGMPLVDGGVVLQPGIGARPSGVGDLLPELTCRQRLVRLAVGAAGERATPVRRAPLLGRAQGVRTALSAAVAVG